MKFEPATRKPSPLLIGIGGMSGSGKTYSALQLATGLCGGKKIAVCDTERGRALHYADAFDYNYGAIVPPFTPETYIEALAAAEGFVGPGGVIIIDSMSHEWEGDGGLLETANNKASEMAKRASDKAGRYIDPSTYTFMSWRDPKQRHQQFVNRLLQSRAHIILCFRAKEKSKIVKTQKRQEIVSVGVQPIMEENLPYETTLFAMLNVQNPGVPDFSLKTLPKQFHGIFNGHMISPEHGKKLLAWARGTTKSAALPPGGGQAGEGNAPQSSQPATSSDEWEFVKQYREACECAQTEAQTKQLAMDHDKQLKALGEEPYASCLAAWETAMARFEKPEDRLIG